MRDHGDPWLRDGRYARPELGGDLACDDAEGPVSSPQAQQLRDAGAPVPEIAKTLGVGRTTVYPHVVRK